jgi:uncharacterized MAPEG superfamily protein
MTIAEYCLFAAVIIYLLTIAPAKAIGFRQFDNSKPRDPAFYSLPLRARMAGCPHKWDQDSESFETWRLVG